MLDIPLSHVQGAEAVLTALRDPDVVLEKVARQVAAVPPLAERLRDVAQARAQRPVRNGEAAVHMLGSRCVAEETRALVTLWLEAMERGQARVVTPPPARLERPQTTPAPWRRAARGA